MKTLRVGIDSYCLDPMKLTPFEVLDWVKQHGGQGVQFTGIAAESFPKGKDLDDGLLREIGSHAKSLGLYLEWGGARHIPFNLKTGTRVDVTESILESARKASVLGVSVIRSCSGGLMRWNDDLPPTETLLRGMVGTLKPLLPRLSDLGVVLAIETHFEFTTFELLRVFDACGVQPGGPLGICLDTMNLMVMLEHPVLGLDRVLPWIVATHAKDGCIVPHENGFEVFTMEAGTGLIDWPAIMTRLRRAGRNITLSIEDHGGSFVIPYLDPLFLSKFPDVSAQELAALTRLANLGRAMIERGDAAPVPRPDWPSICANRVARGIANLTRIESDTRSITSY